MNFGVNNQLPMYQVGQIQATWLKSSEDLKVVQGNKVNYPNVRALAKIMKGDKVVGYYCKDALNREFAMDSEAIKKALKGKRIRFYNLKLSDDNKLLHEPKGDRLGLDVPPDIFFNYENRELGLRMYYDSKEECVVLLSTRVNKYLKFRISLYNNNRAWFMSCYKGDLIDGSKVNISNITDIIYRDYSVDCIDEFIQGIVKIVRNSEAKSTTLSDDAKAHFEREWARRFEYLDDYHHGHSEDSEKAYHALEYLRSVYRRYDKTWDIDF